MTRSVRYGVLVAGQLFLLAFVFFGCKSLAEKQAKLFSLVWEDGRAVGLSIPKSLLDGVPDDSLSSNVEIKLANHGKQPFMAGELSQLDDEFRFHPLIPFTRGLRYAVFIKHELIAEIEIPEGTLPPALSGIYPSGELVPENLLKIYLVFSKPMVTGNSLKYISIRTENGDSLPDTFLDLKHELWNANATMLTLWLDPGRIKRDLQPNLELGRPLQAGKSYQLIVSDKWPDREGKFLGKTTIKKITAQEEDMVSPSPAKWGIRIPAAQTNKPLVIDFGEPLDYAIQQTAFKVVDAQGKKVDGSMRTLAQEIGVSFVPAKAWVPGPYRLLVESRLEDLAGNSINRVFDFDLSSNATQAQPKKIIERRFTILPLNKR